VMMAEYDWRNSICLGCAFSHFCINAFDVSYCIDYQLYFPKKESEKNDK